jgi:hypothetical protein
MGAKKDEKIVRIIERLLDNSYEISYSLMILFFTAIIQAIFLEYAYVVYGNILCIQISIIYAVIVTSIYHFYKNKSWIKELSDKKEISEEEKKLMISFFAAIIQAIFLGYPKIFYGIILGIQISIICVIIAISIYLFSEKKRWGRALNDKQRVSDYEKTVMAECGYRDDYKWISAKEKANDALSEFKDFWIWIWFSWLALYIAFFVKYWLDCRGVNTPIIHFFLNPLSNLNTLMLLICYLILAEITISDELTGIAGKPNWAPWASLFVMITFVEIIIRFIFQSNSAYTGPIETFDWVNGITSGAVMALFVGVFDTEFMKTKFVYLLSFYLYMAFQAVFPFFLNSIQPDEAGGLAFKALISMALLVCKVILFLFVFAQIKSGRLLFYLIRIRKLHYDSDHIWKNFSRKARTFTE